MSGYLLFGSGNTTASFVALMLLAGVLFCIPLAVIWLAWRERWQVERKRLVEEE